MSGNCLVVVPSTFEAARYFWACLATFSSLILLIHSSYFCQLFYLLIGHWRCTWFSRLERLDFYCCLLPYIFNILQQLHLEKFSFQNYISNIIFEVSMTISNIDVFLYFLQMRNYAIVSLTAWVIRCFTYHVMWHLHR